MIRRLIFTPALIVCCAAAALAQNIGIGTATPAARLQVIGDLDVRTVVMDSSEVADQTNFTGSTGVSANDEWQSFTPGVNGALTRVDIYAEGGSGFDVSYQLKIYAGEGTGGALLATVPSVNWGDGNIPAWFTYDIPAPPTLVSGQKYTWQTIQTAGAPGLGPIGYSNANPYAGGKTGFGDNYDLDFRTFMRIEVLDTVPTLHADIGRVGIGTATAVSSSKLEISSDSSGILIPRMTAATRDAMASPATGLLVYVTGNNVFSYYDGTSWVSFGGTVTQLADADADTRILVEKTSDEDTIFFQVAGTEYFRMVPGRLDVVHTGNSIIIGEGAGGNDDFSDNNNVYIGHQTGRISVNTSNNTFIGNEVGFNASAGFSTAIGKWVLYGDSGGGNTAIGSQALGGNTTGNSNTGLGFETLYYNPTGNNNTAAGALALHAAKGSNNTAMGFSALHGIVGGGGVNTGYSNTAIGSQSLHKCREGYQNTAVGDSALASILTGWGNTALGCEANVSSPDLVNSIAIGNGAIVNANSKIRLGNTSVTMVEGQVAYTFPSDARFKDNVQTDVPGLEFILKLNPVSYNFDRLTFARHIGENTAGRDQLLRRQSEQRSVGFLAQEVEKLVEESGFVAFDAVHTPANEKDNYSLSYALFVVPLVKTVQELASRNGLLQTHFGRQQQLIVNNKAQIMVLVQRVEALEAHASGQVIK